MRSTQPPAFATWLLRHFGSSPHNDSILGDLNEQYQLMPSTIWYWKQCLKAIGVGLFSECRGHKWLTLRAMIIGWTVLLFVLPRSFGPIRELLFALGVWSRWWRHSWLLPTAWTFNALLLCMIAGWLIARFHRPYEIPMVLIFALSSCCVTLSLFLDAAIEGMRWWPPYVMPFAAPISIMFGGGLFVSREDTPPSTINKPADT